MEQQPHVNSGGEATCAVGGQAHRCACVGRRCPLGAPLAVSPLLFRDTGEGEDRRLAPKKKLNTSMGARRYLGMNLLSSRGACDSAIAIKLTSIVITGLAPDIAGVLARGCGAQRSYEGRRRVSSKLYIRVRCCRMFSTDLLRSTH